MQAAFLDLRVFPPPSASAYVLTRRYGTCAWCTANARVALVVQRIVVNVELFEISPYVGQAPVQQRAEFVETVGRIEFRLSQVLSRRRLIAAQTGYPCALAAQGAFQWLHLADMAAAL